MKTKIFAVNTGAQKFDFIAETASEVAALKTFERVLKASPEVSVALFQEDAEVLNVSFQITAAEFSQWQEASKT
jgi:hypothetical protein